MVQQQLTRDQEERSRKAALARRTHDLHSLSRVLPSTLAPSSLTRLPSLSLSPLDVAAAGDEDDADDDDDAAPPPLVQQRKEGERDSRSLTSVDIRITHLSLASLLLCQSLTSERLLCCDQEPEQTVHRPRDPHMKDPDDDDDDEDEDEKEDEEAARW